MSQIYIYSTLTNSQSLEIYESYPGIKAGKGSTKPSIRKKVVNIQGGANLNATGIETPKGVCTIITDGEYNAIKEMSVFKRWVERGFILVEKSEGDADDVANDMTAKDASAQHTTEEHEARFESGETSADVVVDETAPTKKRAPKKRATKSPAAKAEAEAKADEE